MVTTVELAAKILIMGDVVLIIIIVLLDLLWSLL